MVIYVCNEAFKERIEAHLKKDCRVMVYGEVDSTNRIIKQMASNGADEGTLVIASRQTSGRGRLGRTFFSPEGGLYMSLLLRPAIKPDNALFITVAAAVAVAEAIEEISGKTCMIKWVNDIYIDGKKVCGILTEGAFSADVSRFEYAVLGLGINLVTPRHGFPSEISDRAAAVFGDTEIELEVKSRLAALIVDKFFDFYEEISQRRFVEEYRRRSYLDGLTVCFERDGEMRTAKVVGIDADAGLTVNENGSVYTLRAGDVSVKPIDGGKDD